MINLSSKLLIFINFFRIESKSTFRQNDSKFKRNVMRTESSELESDLDESGLEKKKKNLSGASQVSHSNNTSYGQVPSYLVTEENESDRYIQVAVLGDGHCFGELSLISHKPRSATIK